MILAMRITLLVFMVLFFLSALGTKSEQRGYLEILGGTVTAVLLFLSYKIL